MLNLLHFHLLQRKEFNTFLSICQLRFELLDFIWLFNDDWFKFLNLLILNFYVLIDLLHNRCMSGVISINQVRNYTQLYINLILPLILHLNHFVFVFLSLILRHYFAVTMYLLVLCRYAFNPLFNRSQFEPIKCLLVFLSEICERFLPSYFKRWWVNIPDSLFSYLTKMNILLETFLILDALFSYVQYLN